MLKTASIALVMIVLASQNVSAIQRNATTTGPYGGSTSVSGSTYCTPGVGCTSSQTRTGRYGNTATRTGGTSCANGVCSGGATYTGPAGASATRSRSISR